jgi:hypothetical protein
MCGFNFEYTDTYAIKNTVNFFELLTLSVGKTAASEGDTELIREDKNRYEKVILNGGTVEGIILQGEISHSGFWQYLIKNRIDISGIGKSVWDISFADFFDTDDRGQYKWSISA